MPEARIDLVFFEGCPHAAAARTNLNAALERLGRTAGWNEWDLMSDGAPGWTADYSSPTVLVEGKDVTGADAQPGGGGMSCRRDGAPTEAQIVSALSSRDERP